MKIFKEEIVKFRKLLEDNTPFSFIRFSDGELFILKNQEVKLTSNSFIAGGVKGAGIYTEEEQKHYLPGRDEYQRLYLLKSLQYKKENYFKGIPSRSDTNESNFRFMVNLSTELDENNLTFANLFINSNYPIFMSTILPIFKDREVILIANEKSNLLSLPFAVKKFYPIGNDCLARHIDLPKKIANDLLNTSGALVLCSAASLSNLIGFECFSSNSKNTILDIGSSLNPILGLEGWKYSRDYLKHFWLGIQSSYATREEIW